MAGRDNVLYHARLTANATAGDKVNLSKLIGIENVRKGFGTPVLKSVRAHYAIASTDTNTIEGVEISIQNSNWIDAAGLVACNFNDVNAMDRNNLAFMRGRDKALIENSGWIITATMPAWTYNASTAPYFDIFVLLEIEYSALEGINTEGATGSPVMKIASNSSVTGSALSQIMLGSYDNLLQNVNYVLSEVSMTKGITGTAQFLIVQGFARQSGLMRIVPIKAKGSAIQIEGSVYLQKQTYNLALLSNVALSSTATQVNLEMIASSN